MPPFIVAALFVILTVLEWSRMVFGLGPQPHIFTALAVAALAYFLYASWRVNADRKRWRQGVEGEKAVGQYLETLRNQSASVFHDIPADGFNLDHVVIHASGIYVIETKTYSKPDRGEPNIRFDGERILACGRELKRDPVRQVRAAASWLRQLIQESTGKSLPVRPVVVFPGWYIEPTADAKGSDIWVLNPKALPSFISHSGRQLADSDVKLAAYHLSRYVRTFEPAS